LAGSADTGGLPVKRAAHRGWMNTFLLRHIAERAANCQEALRIIEQFVTEGYYAGGGKTGTHWLFVDASGQRLEVSNNSDEVEHAYHTQKAYFSARRENAAQLLQRAEAPIDFAAFHNVSRDPSMCFASSIAGMSVEIDRRRPDMLTYAWISLPAGGLSFPLYMGGAATPRALLNGEVFTLSNEIPCGRVVCERIEAAAFGDQELLKERVLTLLAAGQERSAQDLLDRWARACTDRHLAVLER
jgi:hypothetical protein